MVKMNETDDEVTLSDTRMVIARMRSKYFPRCKDLINKSYSYKLDVLFACTSDKGSQKSRKTQCICGLLNSEIVNSTHKKLFSCCQHEFDKRTNTAPKKMSSSGNIGVLLACVEKTKQLYGNQDDIPSKSFDFNHIQSLGSNVCHFLQRSTEKIPHCYTNGTM